MQLGSLLGSLAGCRRDLRRDDASSRLTLAALVASQFALWSAKIDQGARFARAPGRVARRREASREGERRRLCIRAHGGGVRARDRSRSFASRARGDRSCSRLRRSCRSRGVYSGAHLPLDVVGGAGLGLALGHALAMGVRPRRRRASRPRSATDERARSDQMKPRRSSKWKLIQPGRIGSQYVTSR